MTQQAVLPQLSSSGGARRRPRRQRNARQAWYRREL